MDERATLVLREGVKSVKVLDRLFDILFWGETSLGELLLILCFGFGFGSDLLFCNCVIFRLTVRMKFSNLHVFVCSISFLFTYNRFSTSLLCFSKRSCISVLHRSTFLFIIKRFLEMSYCITVSIEDSYVDSTPVFMSLV